MNSTNSQEKILITGAHGVLADYVCRQFEKNSETFPLGKNELDVRDYKKMRDVFSQTKPDFVIHLAALTNVDYCQKNPEDAFSINSEGTKNIARACKESGASLLYVSTASVFDGEKDIFFEDDTPAPIHIYGESKLKGEQYILNTLEDYIILRIGWLIGGSMGGKKFISYILEKIIKGEEIKIVSDKFGTISYASEVTNLMQTLLKQKKKGIFHFGSSGECSRLTIAEELKKLARSTSKLIPVPSSEFETEFSAPRPTHEVIGSRILEYPFTWQESLENYYKKELEH